jgi:hypothetical protein
MRHASTRSPERSWSRPTIRKGRGAELLRVGSIPDDREERYGQALRRAFHSPEHRRRRVRTHGPKHLEARGARLEDVDGWSRAQVHRTGDFLQYLYNSMRVKELGATTVTGLRDNVAYPKQTGKPTGPGSPKILASTSRTRTSRSDRSRARRRHISPRRATLGSCSPRLRSMSTRCPTGPRARHGARG